MSNHKVHSFTITLNGEYTDSDGYVCCSTCKSKTILVMPHSEWIVDEEPYKAGEQIELDSEIEVYEVTGHWCPKCELLISLTYNWSS